MPEVARALVRFAIAGLAEIGGGWLVWQWLRESRPWPIGLVGALVLISYGVIVTFQADPHFGRVYAAYGGIFIVMALGWGYLVDGFRPIAGTSSEQRSACSACWSFSSARAPRRADRIAVSMIRRQH